MVLPDNLAEAVPPEAFAAARGAVDGPSAGIVVIDPQGLILDADDGVAALAGLPSGTRLAGLEVSGLWPLTAPKLLAVANSGRQAAGLSLDDVPRCHLQTRPLPGGAGGLIVTVFDLRRASGPGAQVQPADPMAPFYKRIFETSPDGVIICDAEGRLVLVNQASAEQIGLPVDEILGRPATILASRGLQDQVVCLDVLRTRKPVTRLIRRLRTNRVVLATGHPILRADGGIQLVVVNERDLTDALELMTDPAERHWLEGRLDSWGDPGARGGPMYDVVEALSAQMDRTVAMARRLAGHGVREILITGESGTGKGLIAKFIHANSQNAREPFLHLNCAAMPEALLEAELFGYERGAFTGADPGGRAGLLETVGRGFVFLDEIGEMPLPIQAKLLTFLDNHEFRRVGGTKVLKSPCSVVAATNRDLEELMSLKRFREDLYFRLSAFLLHLPPLRERPEDVLEMARRKLAELNRRYRKAMILDPAAIKVLQTYDFPGNVRELYNCLHQAVIMSPTPRIGGFLKAYMESQGVRSSAPAAGGGPAACACGVPPSNCPAGQPPPQGRPGGQDRDGPEPAAAGELTVNLDATERTILQKALATCSSTREMAHRLGISQAGVSRKLRKHNLQPPGRRPAKRQAGEDDPAGTGRA